MDLSRYDDFFFDCDGVLWSGSAEIPGSVDALYRLQSLGKRVFLVTNNSTMTQEEVARKAAKFGFRCEAQQVYSSARATALYIRKVHPKVKKVYLIGEPSFRLELQRVGLSVVHKSDFPHSRIQSLEHLKSLKPEPGIDAVVVGYQVSFNYLSAYYGSICLQRGAKLIASNCDRNYCIEGVIMPAAGAFVAFMEAASDCKAEVVGKPQHFFIDWAQEQHGITVARSLMVGDNLETDIQFARNAGMDSLLVLTGVTSVKEAQESAIKSTYILPRLSSLFSL